MMNIVFLFIISIYILLHLLLLLVNDNKSTINIANLDCNMDNNNMHSNNMHSNNQCGLDNIVGLESVKQELKYYMNFIRDKAKYAKWNVKLPKGVLLVGPPGTGKTLLVKTLAKQIGIPVISTSGSEFVEMFVGVGASRVRSLFNKAKNKGTAIIFIDEIDAVGKKRQFDNNSERDSTLNQLLVEMDGFSDSDNVMVFAATNLVKNLDDALLRSGRFDKKIYFDPPNKEERIKIFELYLKDTNHSLDYSKLGELTSGITGADINNICNQAKIITIMDNSEIIKTEHIEKAIDEVMIGREKPERKMTKEELERVAYHEAGHALLGYLLKESSHPIKVSILPRGENALGFSMPKPSDKKLFTQDYFKSHIAVLLGGRVVEKIIYDNLSSGAYDDIEKITNIVTNWFFRFGMDSNYGALNYVEIQKQLNLNTDVYLETIKNFVKEIENKVEKVLTKHLEYVEKIKDKLLEKETILYSDLNEILDQNLENSLNI
jgi:ATP-dependent metalloprotease FtsH